MLPPGRSLGTCANLELRRMPKRESSTSNVASAIGLSVNLTRPGYGSAALCSWIIRMTWPAPGWWTLISRRRTSLRLSVFSPTLELPKRRTQRPCCVLRPVSRRKATPIGPSPSLKMPSPRGPMRVRFIWRWPSSTPKLGTQGRQQIWHKKANHYWLRLQANLEEVEFVLGYADTQPAATIHISAYLSRNQELPSSTLCHF